MTTNHPYVDIDDRDLDYYPGTKRPAQRRARFVCGDYTVDETFAYDREGSTSTDKQTTDAVHRAIGKHDTAHSGRKCPTERVKKEWGYTK